jgi:hypothetical protein
MSFNTSQTKEYSTYLRKRVCQYALQLTGCNTALTKPKLQQRWRRSIFLILTSMSATHILIVDAFKEAKGKAVPLQARCGPEDSRRFRLPDFHDIRHMKVVRLSASRTGRLYPQERSWYSFSLGAESSPGPWYGRKEICHWTIQWHHRESMPGPSD